MKAKKLSVGDKIYSDVSRHTYEITWVSPVVSQAEVGFAKAENGESYFIKKLLKPKYPISEETCTNIERVRAQCDNFFKKYSKVYNSVRNGCGEEGACVPIIDFFRNGSSYYTVYHKINADTLSLEDISKLPTKEKYKILLRLVQGLQPLHVLGIIHGDLKPDNILVQKKEDSWKIRLIDMNDCYLTGQPNEPGNVLGTMEYYSPELATYNFYEIDDYEDEEEMALVRRRANALTVKSDVFALGIIFCEFYSGHRPIITDENVSGFFEAATCGALELPEEVQKDRKICAIIEKMLEPDYHNRLSLTQVGAGLQRILINRLTSPEIVCEPQENDDFRVSLMAYSDGEILYTTDGTPPTLCSKKYETPFIVRKFTTIKAVTTDGRRISEEKSMQAWQMRPRSRAPQIIVKRREVSIIPNDMSSLETKLYYTLDNTPPTESSILYTEKFIAPTEVLVRAIAIEPNSLPSREANSKRVYKEKISKPTIHYKFGRVSMESPEKKAIYYTLDGSMPTNRSIRYTEEFMIADTSKFHVIAICIDEDGASSEISEIQRPSGLLK